MFTSILAAGAPVSCNLRLGRRIIAGILPPVANIIFNSSATIGASFQAVSAFPAQRNFDYTLATSILNGQHCAGLRASYVPITSVFNGEGRRRQEAIELFTSIIAAGYVSQIHSLHSLGRLLSYRGITQRWLFRLDRALAWFSFVSLVT